MHWKSALRNRSAKISNRILLGNFAGDLPSNYSRSILESASEGSVSQHLISSTLVTPANVEEFSVSELPQWFSRSKSFDATHCYEMRDIRVDTKSGAAWIEGGPFLGESYGSLLRTIGWGDVRAKLIEKPQDRFDEPVICAADNGFFHWITEGLPSLIHSLRIFPDSRVLLHTSASRYVREAVAELVDPEKVLVTKFRVVIASRLVLTAVTPYSGFIRRSEIDLLRKSFSHDGIQLNKIYVSRSATSKRRIANELELEQLLQEFGYTVINSENLSFKEQRALFRNVKSIIAPHGAGLANLVWSEQRPTVHEIFPLLTRNDCFARLTAQVGGCYAYSSTSPGESEGGQVNLNEFESWLLSRP